MNNDPMKLLREGKILWTEKLGRNNCIRMRGNSIVDSYNSYYSVDKNLDWIVVGDLNRIREMEERYRR